MIAPSSRHSAFIGVPHFATAIAKSVAEKLNLDFRTGVFKTIAATHKGHHPRREKDPPELAEQPPAKVLLIDDTATSGTTLELHVKALKAAGANVTAAVWIYGEQNG